MKFCLRISNIHEIGAITINDDEVLNESLLALARTGVITVNTVKSIQTGKKIQVSVRRLADNANKLRGPKKLQDIQQPSLEHSKTYLFYAHNPWI